MSIQTAVIIGSGNVATHLAKWLHGVGVRVEYVYSKNSEHAAALAEQVGANVLPSIKLLPTTLDLIVIAVNDNAIESVSASLPLTQALVVHTSGITSMSVLEAHPRYGVLYPLQTLSKLTYTQPHRAPLLVEAHSVEDVNKLLGLAALLGSMVQEVNSEQRKVVHLAAVFANNFGNHLFSIAAHILENHHLPFELIRPLIEETARKVQQYQPQQVQTGPAVRNDTSTIATHLHLLMELPHYRQLYELMSTSIREQHNND
jgi:predicted short-subunit dehydrogenase-like oxidoreductase (DUF2520 family)